jgi:hypothetical protein
MTDVGHDGRGMDSRYKMSGMTQKKNIPLAILSEGDMSDVGNGKAYNERTPDRINPPESPFF